MRTRPTISVWAEANEAERHRVLSRNGTLEALTTTGDLTDSVAALVQDVRERGDLALVDALAGFDSVSTTASQLKVPLADFARARERVGPELLDAIRFAVARSTAFNREIVRRSTWTMETDAGWVGEVGRPIESVGLFVPSGKGSFPSVMVQIGCAAVAAGHLPQLHRDRTADRGRLLGHGRPHRGVCAPRGLPGPRCLRRRTPTAPRAGRHGVGVRARPSLLPGRSTARPEARLGS